MLPAGYGSRHQAAGRRRAAPLVAGRGRARPGLLCPCPRGVPGATSATGCQASPELA